MFILTDIKIALNVYQLIDIKIKSTKIFISIIYLFYFALKYIFEILGN